MKGPSAGSGYLREELEAQLARVVASPAFARAGRMSRFLRFVVEQSVDGTRNDLKEYTVGLAVFDRPASFDPQTDSVVRGGARRLRGMLLDYYAGPGRLDPIRIELPKGTYVPVFSAGTLLAGESAQGGPTDKTAARVLPVETGGGSIRESRRQLAYRLVVTVLVVALGSGALWVVSNRGVPQAGRPAPLTTFRGFEANPALSPDANHVAFTWNGEKQDNFDIYVMPIPSGTPVRLTVDPQEDVSPAWSPDGHSIAFLRRLGNERSALVVVPATGGPEHPVAETREKPWFAPRKPRAIAWSPDGRWIAASHREPEEVSEGIYLFSLTGEKRRLTSASGSRGDQMPAFSPDGSALAFCRLPGGFVSDIYLLPLDANLRPSGEVRRLTDNNRWSGQPTWTSDGRQILYLFGDEAGRGREIRSINVSNPPTVAGTIPLNDVSEITVGRHLVFTRQFEDTNIWRARLPVDGDAPLEAQPFISSTWLDQTPSYSPDGNRVAFISSRSGSREIWVSKADGSNSVRITSFGGPLVGDPKWSPDGQWIAFHARPDGPTEIFAIPAAGGVPKRLTTNNWEDSYPIYSRDGGSIFFSSRRSGEMQIWRMGLDGSDPVRISTASKAHVLEESADGKTIFYHLQQDPGEVWSVSVQGGQSRKVIGPTQLYPSGLRVTAKGIYYGAPPHSGEQRFIRFFNFATSKSTPAVIAHHRFHTGMSVSPDGQYILFDQYDESSSDLMFIQDFRPR